MNATIIYHGLSARSVHDELRPVNTCVCVKQIYIYIYIYKRISVRLPV